MNQLIKAMIDKKVLDSETIITANYSLKDNLGRIVTKQADFALIDINTQGEEYKLELRHLIGNDAVYIWATDVIALDGMKPERYVAVYDINPDGSAKKVGKKRGRKPKVIS